MKAPARPAAAHRRPSRFARFARTRVGPPPLGRRRRGRSRGSGRRGRRGTRTREGRGRPAGTTPRGRTCESRARVGAIAPRRGPTNPRRRGRGARRRRRAAARATRPSSSSSAGSRERSRRASSAITTAHETRKTRRAARKPAAGVRGQQRAHDDASSIDGLPRRDGDPRAVMGAWGGLDASEALCCAIRTRRGEKRRSLGETGEVEEGRGEATATTRPSEAVRRGCARGSAGDGGGRRRGRERPHRPPVRGASASLFRGVQDAPRVSRHFSERENTTTRVCRFEVPLQRRARSALDRCAGPCTRRRHGFSVPRHLAGRRRRPPPPPPRRLDGSAFHTLRLHRAPHGERVQTSGRQARGRARESKRARASDAPGPPPHVPTWAMNPRAPMPHRPRDAEPGDAGAQRDTAGENTARPRGRRRRLARALPRGSTQPSPPTAALVCHPPSRPSVRRRRARRRRRRAREAAAAGVDPAASQDVGDAGGSRCSPPWRPRRGSPPRSTRYAPREEEVEKATRHGDVGSVYVETQGGQSKRTTANERGAPQKEN